MASFSHFWALTLFLVTVLRASHVEIEFNNVDISTCSGNFLLHLDVCPKSSHQCFNGSQVSDDLCSSPPKRKLLESTSIGKKSEANGGPRCLPHDCVPDPQLKGNLDYACGHSADCNPIQPGGSCFGPSTMQCHAAYAMNSYFQTYSRDPRSRDFKGTGTIMNNDPSYGNCEYPG